MDSTVTLIVTRGPLAGQKFVFSEPASCLIGSSTDCTICLPEKLGHLNVSRHHCLFEFAPPAIWVHDLGSLKGTYVNGKKIGQRVTSPVNGDWDGNYPPPVRLFDGDEIRLDEHTVFRVCIYTNEEEASDQTNQASSIELLFEE